MTADAMPPARSAEQTAEELASGLAEQRRRVEAMSGTEASDRADLATVLGEIDVAHEELRVAEEELRAQQRRLDALLAERSDPRAWHRGLVGSLPVLAVVTDPAGSVLELNPVAEAMLGRRREDVVDRPLAELVEPRDHGDLEQTLRLLGDGAGTRTVTLSLLRTAGAPTELGLVVGADGEQPGSLLTWVASGRGSDEDPGTGLRTAEAFAEMCRLPLSRGADTRTVLAAAAALVEKAVPASDGVSITLGPPDDPETQATDNLWAQEVDGAQLRAAEGPCLDAYRTGTLTTTDDLRLDGRWPALAPLADPIGVASVIGCPIRDDRQSLGVLNVYSRRSGAFDERDRHVAGLLVSAVLAVVQETRDRNELTELSSQLREALESRAMIDQAKGILMSRNRVTPDQAFAQLVASSRRSNTKVRDVARAVVEAASGPGGAAPSRGDQPPPRPQQSGQRQLPHEASHRQRTQRDR